MGDENQESRARKHAEYIEDELEGIDGVSESRSVRLNHEDSRMTDLLELLGQRWTASILISLHNGHNRFNKLSKELGVNPNTLKVRLRDLEELGYVYRIVESAMPPRVDYGLTDKGKGLAEIVERLQTWALSHVE